MFDLEKTIEDNKKQISEAMWDIVLKRNETTQEDFMQKYGFTKEDTKELYFSLSKMHYYSTRTTQGPYPEHSERYTDAYEQYKQNYQNQLAKLALQKTTAEIPADEISEELLDTLHQKGYDGKSGSQVLQSMYKMYCESKGKDIEISELNRNLGNLQDQNSSLEEKNAEMQNKINNLVSKNYNLHTKVSQLMGAIRLLANIVGKQSSNIKTIKESIQATNPSVEQLKASVNPKSFVERLKSLFSRKYQQKRLEAPNSAVDSIKQTLDSIRTNCDNTEASTKQNMPNLDDLLENAGGSKPVAQRTDIQHTIDR